MVKRKVFTDDIKVSKMPVEKLENIMSYILSYVRYAYGAALIYVFMVICVTVLVFGVVDYSWRAW